MKCTIKNDVQEQTVQPPQQLVLPPISPPARRQPRLRPVRIIIAVFFLALIVRLFVLDAAVVQGRSMLPTIVPDAVVIVFKAAYGIRLGSGYILRWASPQPGQIVAASNPVDGAQIVKRVAQEAAERARTGNTTVDAVFLVGDNPLESEDSRQYGLIPVELVRGRVLLLR